MRHTLLALTAAVLLLLWVGVGTAAADPPLANQAIGQTAGSGQATGAASGAAQIKPANQNISVRVLSPDGDGDVTQTNSVDSTANAVNNNAASQDASQTQSGDPCCGGETQAVGQSAQNDQAAAALSLAIQFGAMNANTPVRVLSPGDDGDVTQTNSVSSSAKAGNANAATQNASQTQSGGCGCTGTIQPVAQPTGDQQGATAAPASTTSVPTGVSTPTAGDPATQANTAASSGMAGNANTAGQTAGQSQAGGSGATQAVGQKAENHQSATAKSLVVQAKPQNSNISVRVLSPGDDGDVTQTNSVSSDATANNANATGQTATQSHAGGSGTQAAGQSADNEQDAKAASLAAQKQPTNSNTSVRVLSPGDGGDVTQTNSVSSDASATNHNATKQKADQSQAGGSCGCGSGGVEAIGEKAESEQDAKALSAAAELGASNANAPVRVMSSGDDGWVSQENNVDSQAEAGNTNQTMQAGSQMQGGGSGSSAVQAIGQKAENEQWTGALSAGLQLEASNSNAPVRVSSSGDDGDVTQENGVASRAKAANWNGTAQAASQSQAGSCGCGLGTAIQATGQLVQSRQDAEAASLALQAGLRSECGCGGVFGNANAPARVWSPGDGGSVSQSNDASSEATAGNANRTAQAAGQTQAGGDGSNAIQAIGQWAQSWQSAAALSAAEQLEATNHNAPLRIWSWGDDGSVSQENDVGSKTGAWNANGTAQAASQSQAGSCGCGLGTAIQASGQLVQNGQLAKALAAALQAAAVNSNAPTRVASLEPGGADDRLDGLASLGWALDGGPALQGAAQGQGYVTPVA